jgi:AAA domain
VTPMADDPEFFGSLSGEDTEREEFLRQHGAAPPNGNGAHDENDLICAAALPHDIADIPPRTWAYGYFLMFGEVGAIGAVDGGGKGAHAVAITLSFITGQALLGERVWRSGPVAIITYEDSEIEWRRRIAAACIFYHLDYKTVITSVYFIRHPGRPVRIADRAGNTVIFPDGDKIVRHLKQIGAVLTVLDPLNHCHAIEDGNSNALMAPVARELTNIGRQANVAALVLHHLRKGQSGTADDFMGAIVLRATFRAVRILSRMSEKEADELGLAPRQAWRHSRISGSKENYSPPPELATWYKLESVAIGNTRNKLYPEGDNVQVATCWSPPSAFEGIPLHIIADIFAAIRKGPEPNEFYSPDRRANRWVGYLIIKHTEKKSEEVARLVRAWMKSGVLVKDQYDSPERRETVGCVTLNEAKVAEILAPLAGRPGE